ncbi:MAG: methionine--tRNA ligase, partial [Pseudomonadota bacterium]|nr:methionine--tRNA ligase [Pseudomonadota bacterium]
VSRASFSGGIPVPGDEKHVMYVWLDALANYITALGYPQTGPGSDYAKYWPTSLHVVGKEITRFHAVYWPAFLMAAGLDLPKRIFAHGLWLMDGEKMSKSLGNTMDPETLVKTWGLDPLRYYFMREVPFGNDGNFSKEGIIHRINHELANDYGNLVQRVLAQVQKNCGAAVPEHGTFTEADTALLTAAGNLLAITRAEVNA